MRLFSLLGLLMLPGMWEEAVGADDHGVQLFESRVRPVLVGHCYRCHSAEAEEAKAGLLVDGRETWLKGGDSGPVLVPGQPEQRRQIEAVRYASPDLKMPPRRRLSDEQVAGLTRWVELGAPWPGGKGQVTASSARPESSARPDMKARRQGHWAWHAVRSTVRYEAWVEGKCQIHDLHATMLHLLGVDHKRLTYCWGGRDMRLTDVDGELIEAILA